MSDFGRGENNLAALLGYGYHHTAIKKGLKASLVFQEIKKGFMHADTQVVENLYGLPQNSVIIVTASNKLGRIGNMKSFRAFCRGQGHRFISATGLRDVKPIHFDLFLEAMNVNYRRMKKKGMAVKKLWDKAKEITVKTEAGTDLTFGVEGVAAVLNVGDYQQPGSGGNIPAGEVYIAPRQARGIAVIDGSIKTDEGALLVDEPVKLLIEDGRIVGMEGKYAARLEQSFQKFESRAKYPERVRLVAELGLGINPHAVLIGSTIMDEKVEGTAHLGIGSNYWFGGDIKTIYHGDQVFKNPCFYVDGKKMEV